ncbi:MAG: tetratricopeptide repeat protein, partial [Planctomycetia bacterium]|nr:tetratricopeptide repeat protein [Planctomycetia bacterium]
MSKKKQQSRKQRSALNRQQRTAQTRPGAKASQLPAPASDLLHGTQFLQRGAMREAQHYFERAIRRSPNDAVAHNCLGIVLRIQQHYADAATSLREAIRLRPEFPEAHNNLGNVLRDQEYLDEAEQCYRRATDLNPRFAEAHCNLGVVLMTRGDTGGATECYRTALAIKPNHVEALNNLGNACRESGDYDSALQYFHAALQLSPHSAELHNNLATSLRDAGHGELAEQHCLEAIRLKPDFAEAHGNLGTIYVDRSEMQLAIDSYERAVALEPESAQLLNNLGNAYKHIRRFDKAMDAFRETARLQPNQPLYQLRTRALCPGIFEAVTQSEQIRRYALETWRRFADIDFSLDLKTLTWVTIEPGFNFQFMEANVRELKEAYAGIFRDRLPKFSVQRRTGKPRVGIVVTRSHEGIFLRSMSNIIERLDAQMCDLVILCSHGATGMIRDRIHRDVEIVGFPERFDHVVSVIQNAAVDVLYYWEIGTDTTNYFLPFLRLAPVQCTSWGIQITSGISEVDYYLSSELVEPDNAQEHYTETLRLARTLLTYQTHPTVPTNPKTREAFGFMPEDHVYACAQQLGKFHPD